jgi:hypothetical protein
VGFSIRDEQSKTGLLGNERGQGIVEYILILVVTVALILGGLYKLNSAFKTFALSYFGDYLSCLLETGELPTIGGTPGDTGICNQLFHSFTLADGRQLKGGTPGQINDGGGGRGGGASEKNASGGGGARSRVSGGGGGGGNFGGGRGFSRGPQRSPLKLGKGGGKGKDSGTYTGSTSTEAFGNYGATNRKLKTGVKHRLDNKFAFDEEKEVKQKRRIAGVSKKPAEETSRTERRSRLKAAALIKDAGEAPDSGMSFPDFMRYIIIAGILIALFLFLGGQMLQIGKSME